jgi:predicted phage terminase large subunit-like protein
VTLPDTIENLELHEDALAASICRDSFFEFVREFWDIIINEDPIYNWHIEYLCNFLQDVAMRVKDRLPAIHDYIIINVPPGSTKSSLVSVMYPMWVWTIDQSQRFICSSYSSTVALDLADRSRRIFRSEKFRRYFPEILPDPDNDSKSQFKNQHGGERYATSTGAGITGVHAHQLIWDDPLNPQTAASEADRKTAITYLDETLPTRKVDKLLVPTIIIMQRLHENDPTGHLLEKAKASSDIRVFHICLPAEASANIKPASLKKNYKDGLFDPKRLPHQAIRKLRAQLGTYAASGQLDQLPSPAEGGILKKRWFETVDKTIPRDATIKFRLDTAYTEKQKNDPSGFFSYFMENGTMYIVNAEEQYMEFPDLEKYIPVYAKNNGYSHHSTIKVEPKASGKSVVQQLKLLPGINIMEGRVPVDDKETRVNSISATCESGRIKLIRGGWNENFLSQIGAFPNGLHDDMLDCLVEAAHEEFIVNMKKYGYRRAN